MLVDLETRQPAHLNRYEVTVGVVEDGRLNTDTFELSIKVGANVQRRIENFVRATRPGQSLLKFELA